MLSIMIINFLIGTIGSLAIFLLISQINGEEGFSAPFFVILIGLVSAILSIFFGYISTWVILGIYAITSTVDTYNSK